MVYCQLPSQTITPSAQPTQEANNGTQQYLMWRLSRYMDIVDHLILAVPCAKEIRIGINVIFASSIVQSGKHIILQYLDSWLYMSNHESNVTTKDLHSWRVIMSRNQRSGTRSNRCWSHSTTSMCQIIKERILSTITGIQESNRCWLQSSKRKCKHCSAQWYGFVQTPLNKAVEWRSTT